MALHRVACGTKGPLAMPATGHASRQYRAVEQWLLDVPADDMVSGTEGFLLPQPTSVGDPTVA